MSTVDNKDPSDPNLPDQGAGSGGSCSWPVTGIVFGCDQGFANWKDWDAPVNGLRNEAREHRRFQPHRNATVAQCYDVPAVDQRFAALFRMLRRKLPSLPGFRECIATVHDLHFNQTIVLGDGYEAGGRWAWGH